MNRAVSPLLGTVLLVGVTVLLVAVVGATVLAVVPSTESPEQVVVSATASSDGEIEFVHEAGPALDVRELSIRITVDDEPLRYQPPVPFFSANGFRPGPTGPFNLATDSRWETGERASVVVAGTNAPAFERGATITVRISRDELPVAVIETRVERS